MQLPFWSYPILTHGPAILSQDALNRVEQRLFEASAGPKPGGRGRLKRARDTRALPRSLAPSLPRSLAPSLPRSLAPSLPPSLAPSLPRSLAPSLPRSLAPSLPRSLAPSLPRSLAPSLPRSLAPSLPRSLAPSLPAAGVFFLYFFPRSSPTGAEDLVPFLPVPEGYVLLSLVGLNGNRCHCWKQVICSRGLKQKECNVR